MSRGYIALKFMIIVIEVCAYFLNSLMYENNVVVIDCIVIMICS